MYAGLRQQADSEPSSSRPSPTNTAGHECLAFSTAGSPQHLPGTACPPQQQPQQPAACAADPEKGVAAELPEAQHAALTYSPEVLQRFYRSLQLLAVVSAVLALTVATVFFFSAVGAGLPVLPRVARLRWAPHSLPWDIGDEMGTNGNTGPAISLVYAAVLCLVLLAVFVPMLVAAFAKWLRRAAAGSERAAGKVAASSRLAEEAGTSGVGGSMEVSWDRDLRRCTYLWWFAVWWWGLLSFVRTFGITGALLVNSGVSVVLLVLLPVLVRQ